jgi:hypothetical protein
LCAEAAVLPGESAGAFRQLTEDLHRHWRPAGEQECFEFEELVRSAWRLLRARHVETQMWSGYILALRNREGSPRPESPLDCYRTIARVLCEEDGCRLDRYHRYERAIERGYYRAVRQLQRTQSLRVRQPRDSEEDAVASADTTTSPASASQPVAPVGSPAEVSEIGIRSVPQRLEITPESPESKAGPRPLAGESLRPNDPEPRAA